jgi:hypothetical protein
MTAKKIRYEKPVLMNLTGSEICEAQGGGGAKNCRLGNVAASNCGVGNTAPSSTCSKGNTNTTGSCATGGTPKPS